MANVKTQFTSDNVQSSAALATTPCSFISGGLKMLQA